MIRSTIITGPEGALRTLTFGDAGDDLLIIPGITSPAAVWGFVARPLARSRQVHVIDLRGRGESDPSPDGHYTLADYAADAAAAIDSLDLDRPAIIGHSLGARIAAALAVMFPRSVGTTVLVDPPLTGPGRPPYPQPLAFYLDGIRQARSELTLEQARRLEPTWTDEQVLDRARWLGSCDELAVTRSWEHFHDEDFHGLWDRLVDPVLIHGGRSAVVSAEGVAEMRARNRTARTIEVAEAGHMIPWDDLDGFLAAVERVLSAEKQLDNP